MIKGDRLRRILGWLLVLLVPLAIVACGGTRTVTVPQPVGTALPQSGTTFGGRTHSEQFIQSAEHPNPSVVPPARFSAAPVILGYDSVNALAIPFGAQAALCYSNGRYANCTSVKGRHVVRLITIAVNELGTGRLLDVEPGDATPSQAGGWVRRMIALKIYRPGVYADAAEIQSANSSIKATGLQRSQYVLMLASWDGVASVPPGYDAKQYRSIPTVDFDAFLLSFFPPATPSRVICWGKGSTPNSNNCPALRKQAHADWVRYRSLTGQAQQAKAAHDAVVKAHTP